MILNAPKLRGSLKGAKLNLGLYLVILLFLLGVLLIVKGGDWFLDGAVWIAEASGIPHFIIGATFVSVATTLPELTVSVTGVLEGEVDLAVGNAVGSVTANIGLILGISILCMPSVVSKKQFNIKTILMIGGAAVLAILCRGGNLTFVAGLLLILIFMLYIGNNVLDAKAGIKESGERKSRQRNVQLGQTVSKLGLFAAGITGIIIGSQLLIDYGSELALRLGVPASIIGVTLVAVGTSLPELVTTLTAIMKKEASMSIGNIVGANVIDLTLILPVCAAVSGGSLAINQQTVSLDLPACLIVTAVAMLPPLVSGRFYRWQGIILLGLYAGYLVMLVGQQVPYANRLPADDPRRAKWAMYRSQVAAAAQCGVTMSEYLAAARSGALFADTEQTRGRRNHANGSQPGELNWH